MGNMMMMMMMIKNSTGLLIRKLPVQRLVQEMAQDCRPTCAGSNRYSGLQEAAEAWLGVSKTVQSL
jgi:histone H3/H4